MDDAKARVFTLPTIMSRLGHSALDILKIDIEGNEYGFLQQLFSSGQGELLRWGAAYDVKVVARRCSAVNLNTCWNDGRALPLYGSG